MSSTHIPEGEYLTKTQVATQKGVIHQTVQQWIDKGWLSVIKLPGLGYLINTKDLTKFKRPKCGRPKQKESNMPKSFKATRRSKKFGWGYSMNPSGDDAYSITPPTSPDYVGTIGQVTDAIASDPVYNNLGGAFSSSRWFYRGRIITHVDGLDASHVDSMGQVTLMELAEDEVRYVTEVLLTVGEKP